MAASRSSRFFAFLVVSLIVTFVLAVSAAPAYAALVTGQADSGASITTPADGKTFDCGKEVTVKAKAKYTRPDGFTALQYPSNYIYLRVVKDGAQVGNLLKKDFSTFPGSTKEVSFTLSQLESEGAYVIEVHHDYTYDENKNHVELDPKKFVADHSRTIIVQKSMKNAEITVDNAVYTGQPLTPAPKVTIDDKELNPDTDYDVSYDNNTNVGDETNRATISVTGKGFYKEQKTVAFNITPADISKATMNNVVDKDYSRSPVTQKPSIIWNGQSLVGDGDTPDYELTYTNNTSVGTATVTAIGKGNFTGELTKSFTINKVSICSLGDPGLKNKTYTGQPITQDISFWYGGNVVEGTDFTTTYKDNVNPGTATVTITGKGNFKDSIVRTFSILEPTPTGMGAWVIAPNDKTQFAVGSPIDISLKAGLFENRVQWVGVQRPTTDAGWNYMYLRIQKKNSTTGTWETVYYTGAQEGSGEPNTPLRYTSASTLVNTTYTPTVKGEYRIQVRRQALTVDGDNKIIYIEESNFSPQNSVTAYVGVTASDAKQSIKNAQISGVVNKYYTGNSITQNPTVKLNGKTLKSGTDYYVTYRGMYSGGTNTVDHGTVTMTIHGKGSYTDTLVTTFEILPKPLTADMIVMTPATLTYNGGSQKPNVVLMNGPFRLSYTVDYDLDIQEGTDPGQYKVVATTRDNRNYTGSATAYYTIEKWPINKAVVTAEPSSYVYDGQAKQPAVSVMLNGAVLSPELYTVSYSKNINAGTAQVAVTAKENAYCTGSASGTFTINPLSIASNTINVSLPNDLVYNRQAQTPTPQVMLGEKPLSNETDFTLSYENNVNAGTAAKVIITGKGNFKNSRTETFAIGKKNISDQTITVDAIPDQCFIEGQPSTPQITVKDGVFQLANGVDYKVEKYENNSAIGTATITISGWGNYTGTKSDITFTICDRSEFVGTLSTAIEQVENEGINQYLAEDNAIVQAALDEANNLVNNDASTPEQLQNALDALNNAVATAKLNLAKKNLSDAADAVDKEGASQYLDADKAAVQAALANVQALLADDAATVEALEQALSELNSVVSTAKTNLSEAQAAQAYERAKAEALAIPSAEVIVKTIMAQKKDADPAGSKFAPLMLKSSKQSKKYNVLAWSKVTGASYYEVYGNKCGNANKLAKIASVKANTFTHKGLKKNTYYKYVVIAIKDTVVGPRALAVSKMIHVATKGGKAKNTKKLTVKAKVGKKLKKVKSTKVKRGKTLKLKVTPSPTSGVKKHVAVRFESSDTKVATVSAKGVVKGVGAGTCFVYAYAQNGICTKVKVQVA